MIVAMLVPTIAIAQNSNLNRGVVLYDANNDYHIVKVGTTNARFAIVKWCSGPKFVKGDAIIGNLISKYSYRDVYVNSNNSKTQAFIEYHYANYNTCFEWLEGQGLVLGPSTTPNVYVYVCTGGFATKYHCRSNCQGLGRCKGEILEITEAEAIKNGRTKCAICFR